MVEACYWGTKPQPQCLHFRASFKTSSRQSGHLTCVSGVGAAVPTASTGALSDGNSATKIKAKMLIKQASRNHRNPERPRDEATIAVMIAIANHTKTTSTTHSQLSEINRQCIPWRRISHNAAQSAKHETNQGRVMVKILLYTLLISAAAVTEAAKLSCAVDDNTNKHFCFDPTKVRSNGELRAFRMYTGGPQGPANDTGYTGVFYCNMGVLEMRDRQGVVFARDQPEKLHIIQLRKQVCAASAKADPKLR